MKINKNRKIKKLKRQLEYLKNTQELSGILNREKDPRKRKEIVFNKFNTGAIELYYKSSIFHSFIDQMIHNNMNVYDIMIELIKINDKQYKEWLEYSITDTRPVIVIDKSEYN